MTLDDVRNQVYRTAIKRHAFARNVMDLGTGAHLLLARLAVAAGAKRVDAVEANSTSYKFAQTYLKNPELADKVALHHGFSCDISVGSPSDMIIHEIVGEVASSEAVVMAIKDALLRHASEDVEVFPKRLRTCLSLMTNAPPAGFVRRGLSKIFGGHARQLTTRGFQCIYNPGTSQDILVSPVTVEDLRFDSKSSIASLQEVTANTAVAEISATAQVVGFRLWPEIEVDGNADTIISGQDITNWSHLYFSFVDKPESVEAGAEVRIEFYADTSTPQPHYKIRIRFPSGVGWIAEWRGTGYAAEIIEMARDG